MRYPLAFESNFGLILPSESSAADFRSLILMTLDSYAISITSTDFATGGLSQDSNVRPNRLFTADANIILYRAGVLTSQKVQEVVAKIIQIVSA